jgi:ribonuclease HII
VLQLSYKNNCLEAGLDEAGRGCLAGPVFASAVILPSDYSNPLLRDSKMLNHRQRENLRQDIENNALAYSVCLVDEKTIDRINILQASIKAMHKAIARLSTQPEHLIIDGNYFKPYKKTPYQTIIKGDNTYMNIAAASILAKTYRDDWMRKLNLKYPQYHWDLNKGYGTQKHVEAIKQFGLTPYHRRSFQVKSFQMDLFQTSSTP